MPDWTSEEGITEEEKFYFYRKAGQIGYEVLNQVKEMIKPDVPIIQICETAEKLILEKGADGFGFPTNVSINNIAAHYSSPYEDENTIPDDGEVKFDVGIHVNGYIADTAVSVVLSPEFNDLKKAAEEGFKAGMEVIIEPDQWKITHLKVELSKDTAELILGTRKGGIRNLLAVSAIGSTGKTINLKAKKGQLKIYLKAPKPKS